jgi:Circularly permutated YpsA SLOG family
VTAGEKTWRGPTSDYPARTRANVEGSNGTPWLGSFDSRGYETTHDAALRRPPGYPFKIVNTGYTTPSEVVAWITSNRIGTLNCAGDRESVNPGIGEGTERFLTAVSRRSIPGDRTGWSVTVSAGRPNGASSGDGIGRDWEHPVSRTDAFEDAGDTRTVRRSSPTDPLLATGGPTCEEWARSVAGQPGRVYGLGTALGCVCPGVRRERMPRPIEANGRPEVL